MARLLQRRKLSPSKWLSGLRPCRGLRWPEYPENGNYILDKVKRGEMTWPVTI